MPSPQRPPPLWMVQRWGWAARKAAGWAWARSTLRASRWVRSAGCAQGAACRGGSHDALEPVRSKKLTALSGRWAACALRGMLLHGHSALDHMLVLRGKGAPTALRPPGCSHPARLAW